MNRRPALAALAALATGPAWLGGCGGGSGGGDAPAPPASGSDWEADLATLDETLRASHPDPDGVLASPSWRDALAVARGAAAARSERANLFAAIGLTARLRDEHTFVQSTGTAFAQTALRFATAADGPWVSAAAEPSLLGAALLAIDGQAVDALFAALRPAICAATDEALDHLTPPLLNQCELLALAGIGAAAERARYRLRRSDGAVVELTLEAGDPRPLTEHLGRPDGPAVPLWLTQPQRHYFAARLHGGRLVYARYRRCAPDPVQAIDDLLDELAAALRAAPGARLVIDLRNNPGGDSSLLSAALARAALRWPGLVDTPTAVLINRGVFSSATTNLYDLRRGLAQVWTVGESPGTAPNHSGELRSVTLPRTRTVLTHSTRRFVLDAVLGRANLVPDLPVAPTIAQRVRGEDPVLERAARLLLGDLGV